jgi:hypothetical protein
LACCRLIASGSQYEVSWWSRTCLPGLVVRCRCRCSTMVCGQHHNVCGMLLHFYLIRSLADEWPLALLSAGNSARGQLFLVRYSLPMQEPYSSSIDVGMPARELYNARPIRWVSRAHDTYTFLQYLIQSLQECKLAHAICRIKTTPLY